MVSPLVVYTVGHSNRPLDGLLALLQRAGISNLVDVRAYPQSRRHPQFGEQALRAGIAGAGMSYHWAGRQLGGRRQPQADSPHRALSEPGFRAYADYMESAAFQSAAMQLLRLAGRGSTAILCAERRPERCHRSLIADYLSLQGVHVIHLIEPGEQRDHALSPQARRESGRLVYDRHATAALDLG